MFCPIIEAVAFLNSVQDGSDLLNSVTGRFNPAVRIPPYFGYDTGWCTLKEIAKGDFNYFLEI
jgi:hypothetical protein